MRFVYDKCCTNPIYHGASNSQLSMPPDAPDQDQGKVPKRVQAKLRELAKAIFGTGLDDAAWGNFRICWCVIAIILSTLTCFMLINRFHT